MFTVIGGMVCVLFAGLLQKPKYMPGREWLLVFGMHGFQALCPYMKTDYYSNENMTVNNCV